MPVSATSNGGPPRRRLRVLVLIDKAHDTGGAERFAVALATHLPQDRIEPWLCSTRRAEPNAVRALAGAGVPHINLGRRAKWDLHRLAAVVALLRRERFDVVHSHMFGSNLWGAVLGRAAGVPVILPHEHVWSYAGNRMRAWLDGHVIGRLATRFLTISEASREHMVGVEHIPAGKIVVMPTAYVPRPGPATDVRAELGLPRGTPLIGVASVLRPQKSLDVMLDAHRLVVERVPEAHLVIAGDGECLPDLQARTDALGLRSHVHFLGLRQDVDSLLRQVEVGAMSSRWEGMPLFALECMAAGTPLVATDVGGLPELIRSGESGLLVPPADPAALAGALVATLLDEDLRRRLAAGAARRIDEFRIDRVASRFADLYEALRAPAALVG